MFGIEALDVVIGLIFIYLLFSLFVTIVNEMIVSLFQIRGKELQFVLFQMLGSTLLKSFYDNDRIKKGMIKSRFRFAKTIYDPHKNKDITVSEENQTDNRSVLPSEIDSTTFVEILYEEIKNELLKCEEPIRKLIDSSNQTPYTFQFLINELRDPAKLQIVLEAVRNNQIECEVLKNERIKKILLQGITSVTHFQNELEKWYDEMMLFLVDWYKRKLKYILLFIGFVIATSFNVDSVSIFKTLANDPETRALVVEQAQSYINNYENENGFPVKKTIGSEVVDSTIKGAYALRVYLTDEVEARFKQESDFEFINIEDSTIKADSIKKEISKQLSAEYPTLVKLDSTYQALDRLVAQDINQISSVLGLGWNNFKNDHHSNKWLDWLIRITGWLITAIALSMGAPFWYDLLRKVINIKNELKGKSTGKERVG